MRSKIIVKNKEYKAKRLHLLSQVYQPTNLYGDYDIGEGTKVGAFCDIGGKIGKNCLIQTGVSIPPLTVIQDNVFIGPGVRFANDPKMDGKMVGTIVEDGVRIGMGSLIQGGIVIGKNSRIGMGSIVLKSVPPDTTVIGLWK